MKKVKRLTTNGHYGDVKYNVGIWNIVKNIAIIMYGARWVLEIWKTLCKVYDYLTTVCYTPKINIEQYCM